MSVTRLDPALYDEANVGPMFDVVFEDGVRAHAFEDEIAFEDETESPGTQGPDVRLHRNHNGSVTAWWSDPQDFLRHRQYILFDDDAIEHDLRETLNPTSITWEPTT